MFELPNMIFTNQIVGGGAGPEQIALEEESTWPV
jgi:hypothetical protein